MPSFPYKLLLHHFLPQSEVKIVSLYSLGRDGNLQLVQDSERQYPGLLIQGGALSNVLQTAREEIPDSHIRAVLEDWMTAYEELMDLVGRDLPYAPPLS